MELVAGQCKINNITAITMKKKQEELFNKLIELQNSRAIAHLGSYIQNDLSPVDDDCPLSFNEIERAQSEQSDGFDVIINKLTVLKKECFEFFQEFLPKTLTGEEIRSMLTTYWFTKTYAFVSKHFNVDIEFIENHDFYVIVTSESVRNGYVNDQKKILTTLKLNEKYKIKSMSVSRSSSTIELCKFPDTSFNSVNFEFSTEYTIKVQN